MSFATGRRRLGGSQTRLALWGLVLLASGCQIFRGGDEGSDETPNEKVSGSGATGSGGTAAKVCTPEEEESLMGDPPFTDDCPKVLNGAHTAPARNAVYPGDPDSVRVTFDQGALVTFEGAPCRPASSGAKTSEFGSCRQYFVCECCTVELERSGSGATFEHIRISSGESCSSDFPQGTQYEVRGASGGTGGTGGQPITGGTGPKSACDTCLSSCRGLSSCCSGVGCICERDCQVTECGPGTAFCCGPYGGCFCSDNCPY